MTNDEIEKIAQRVAELVVDKLPEMKIQIIDDDVEWEFTLEDEIEPQQELLYELARLMTSLELSLDEENYSKCAEIQAKIAKIEDKLKKYKK
jgi:hypothetical protein